VAGHRGARGAGFQRADVRRQHLGQHRHHPVGEIDRIAAFARLAVDQAAGADVERHIGDGDQRAKAPCPIGLRPDRIVVIAGVGGVDRDDRQMGEIFAFGFAQRQTGGQSGLFEHVGGEDIGNAMLVNGDQAEGARGERIAQNGGDFDPGARAAPHGFGQHQIADHSLGHV
jgi:hypothetical protein